VKAENDCTYFIAYLALAEELVQRSSPTTNKRYQMYSNLVEDLITKGMDRERDPAARTGNF
jgi:hypothetical protein